MPTAIITGSNTGLGFETALALSASGFDVVITSRDRKKGESAVSRIQKLNPGSVVSLLQLDLASMQSIEAFSEGFKSQFKSWDVLVNNAGAKVHSKFSRTEFGVEYHFGVNAVGHFALTLDLLPQRSEQARVVTVSSIVARTAPAKMGPAGSEHNYNPGQSYSASKLSNLAFCLELQDRLGSENFSSLAAHPGFAKAEPYGNKSTRFFESFLAQSANNGAKPIVAAAIDKSLPGGSYLGPMIFELWGQVRPAKIPDTLTKNRIVENWQLLEKLSGRKLSV